MGIKYIHLVLIIASIVLFILFGVWTLHHNYAVAGLFSFGLALGLIIYCIQFIKKIRTL